jgi:hypothetical protein
MISSSYLRAFYRFRRSLPGIIWLRVRQFPSRDALQHAVAVLHCVHMPVVLLNHLNGRSHLLGKEIHVHALLQPERGVGMPEAIGRALHALRAFAQIRLV